MTAIPIFLNIAGDRFEVRFDGKRVTTPDFPDIPVEYTASCGMRVTQEMLVAVCIAKKQDYARHYLALVDHTPCICAHGHPDCAHEYNGFCSDELLSVFGLDNYCEPITTTHQ